MADTTQNVIIGTIKEHTIDVSIQKFTSFIGTEHKEFKWPIHELTFEQLLRPFKDARVKITVEILPR